MPNLSLIALDAPQTWPQTPLFASPIEDLYERQSTYVEVVAVAGAAPTMRRLEEQVFQYTYQNLRPRRDLMLQLRNLQQHYLTLDNDRAVVEFFEAEPGLPALLHEAVRPLTTAFGEGSLFHVRLQSSEDETLLKVAVRLPAGFVDAERALCTFDQEWWLNNCHRSGGALVFDYETQDAV